VHLYELIIYPDVYHDQKIIRPFLIVKQLRKFNGEEQEPMNYITITLDNWFLVG
jgi:hypothetical protein